MLTPLFLAAFCLFTPPQSWKLSDPKTPSQGQTIGFVCQKKSGICPSIHLTKEATNLSLAQYLKVAKANCTKKKQAWSHLGSIQTQSGRAALVQIQVKQPSGTIQILQAILLKDHTAHILTAGALKEEFSAQIPLIKEAFSSMRLCDDLFSLASSPKNLEECWKKKREDLDSFQKQLTIETWENPNLGPVWQILMSRL